MKRIKNFLLFLLVLFCIFLGLWTAQDNSQPVSVRLLGFGLPDMSLGIWLLSMLATGALLGMLASFPVVMRFRAENRRLKRDQ